MERMVQEINNRHTSRRRWQKVWSLMAALATALTTYVLILPGVTMSRQLVCGRTDHTHTEFCYEVGPSDVNADVETQEDWEKTLSKVTLVGRREEDIPAVAMTQLGYRESSRNFVSGEGWLLNGYTRYGAWYGNPYGDWDAMFASFVLHYAGVDDFGRAGDANTWAQKIAQELPQRYRIAEGYAPGKGDLVFFDQDLDGEIDRVGLLMEATEDTWRVMEGNAEDSVSLVNYAPGDNRVEAFGLTTVPEETGHTITYAANNGTEETAPQQGSGEVTASENGFSAPKGMTFSSWNTAPDGSGIGYAEGSRLVLTEDMTLYAQWTEAVPTANEPTAAAATGEIVLKKQIEWTGKNADDYSYRLHLTLDGSSLSAGSVTTVTPTEKRHIGILLDVTETMTATSEWGSNGENKFDAVRNLLQGNDGFLNSILDGSTYVSIIVVGGQSGYGTYEGLSKQIAAGDKPGDFSNINNDLHLAQGISYVTGLMAAEKYLGNNIDSLVYIVGNNPDTHIKYSDGTLERGTSGNNAANADYNDYVTFMGNHPQLSMYMVGVAPVNRGSATAEKMGKFSQDRGTGGGYFEASNKDALKDQLTQIAQQIVVPPDKVKDITITDTLSSNVKLPQNPDKTYNYNLTAELKMLDSNGGVTSTTDISSKVTVDTTGKITCTGLGEISGPFKIEIVFDIQTADNVYRPYTDTGDANTDWETNATSSGQKGFFSNGDATATYTLNSDPETTQSFPKPVVQAPQKATITLTKAWVNAAEADKKAVTVELHRGSATGELVGTVTLGPDNWTASCNVKILTVEGASNQIFVVERAVDGFTPSYSAESVSVTANGTYPITITNTKTVVNKTATLTVNKKWNGVTGTQEAKIHVCTLNGTTYQEIEGSPFTVTNGTNDTKTFTYTWTEGTAPVLYTYEESSKDFYPVISGDGTAKTITVDDKQLSAMELPLAADGNYTVTLTNMASVAMPETGGPGTHGFVCGGFVLILGAVLLMQIRKKQNRKEGNPVNL